MKYFIAAFILFAAVAADVSEFFPSDDYLPPVDGLAPLAPVPQYQAVTQGQDNYGQNDLVDAPPAHSFGPDGYQYKNPVEVRRRAKRRYRLRYRHRRY